ncbi:hypothetical protein KCP69_08970 [Salmonella enterica subsp. enterica]|nr:hypothetical protein KCP69_08970 [Salmonella enterica subsp. enterica]
MWLRNEHRHVSDISTERDDSDECATAVKRTGRDLAQRHTGFHLAFGAVAAPAGVNVCGGYLNNFSVGLRSGRCERWNTVFLTRFKNRPRSSTIACGNQLQPLLIKTLLNRAQGALLFNAEGIDDVAQSEEWSNWRRRLLTG